MKSYLILGMVSLLLVFPACVIDIHSYLYVCIKFFFFVFGFGKSEIPVSRFYATINLGVFYG